MSFESAPSARNARWREGDLAAARGRSWRVVSSIDGDACTAVQLRALPDGGPARRVVRSSTAVLLTPFDRLHRVAPCRMVRLVSASTLARILSRAAASVRPYRGLWSAAAADIRLMPYQLAPALAMAVHGATRVLLADDVGLGKTIQAGLILAELRARGADLRSLVLVPAGLREQWLGELQGRFGLNAILADANWLRRVAAERPRDVNPWSLSEIYVASHDFVKRPEVLRPLEDVAWDLVIIDEAHALAAGTDRCAAADAIAQRSARVLLLTATPPWDDARSFRALIDVGRHDGDPAAPVVFRRTRAGASLTSARRSVFLEVALSAAERRMHALLDAYTSCVWREARQRGDGAAGLVAIVLRKRALSSAASVARSVRRRIALLSGPPVTAPEQLGLPLADEDPLPDDDEVAPLGAPCLADVRQERDWLEAIAAAAGEAACAETKIRRLLGLLSRAGESAIVFTEYRDTLLRIHESVAAAGLRTLVMHGGMSAQERARVQARFNEGGTILLATDAASEGLNLHHACRLLVHFELPWRVSRLEQRAGRVDRLGQSRRVHEVALVADHTAERLVLEPLTRRALEARRAGGNTGFLQMLSESDVARTVLEGTPPGVHPVDANLSEPASTQPVEAEASAEAIRLEHVRTGLGRAAAPDAIDRTRVHAAVLTGRQGRLQPGLFLLYVVTVTDAHDVRLHEVDLLVRLELTGGSSNRWRDRLPRMLERLQSADGSNGSLAAAIHPAVHRELSAVDRVSHPAAERLLRRCEGMRHVHDSAAARLIQPGLFARRLIPGVLDREAPPDAHHSLASTAPIAGLVPLTGTAALVAALLVRPARRSR
jgi:superfamily II DNA or RNA helicase